MQTRRLLSRLGSRLHRKRDQELARLRAELAQARAAGHLQSFSGRNRSVFFILGRGRSGTTWLRSILNSHPEILCWGEGRFFERSFEREDFEQWELKNIPPSSLYGAISGSKYLKAWVDRSVWARGRDTDTHLVNLTRLAVDYFLAEQLSKTDKRIVGDKTPFVSAEVVEEISVVYPEAKVIHIIRDGRDVAVSMIHHMWNYSKDAGGFYDLEPEDLERRDAYRRNPASALTEGLFTKNRLKGIARGWGAQVGKAAEYGPALLGDNYAEVRYEDLLERPAGELGRLLGFLGADASEETVRRCIEAGSFEKWSRGRRTGEEESSSFYRKGVAGDWKNVFTEEDKRVFKAAAGDTLIELGYEADNDW